MSYEIDPQPPRVGQALVTSPLPMRMQNQSPERKFHLEGDMTHAGMNPVFADAKETGSGRYQAALHFDMAGDWVVLLHASLPGGQKLERQFDLRGVRPN